MLRFALALAALLALAPAAHADDVLDGIALLPGAVEDVRIGGTFEQGGRIGAYRVLVARTGGDPVTARMFVQWVLYEEDGGASVTRTIEISELAELGVDVIDFTSESDADGLSVFIQTIDPNGTHDENFELFIDDRGDYRFGPVSN